jgi:tetratricopeptide (TPR) repeat protein
LGHAYALSGRLAEALPLLEQAVDQTAAREFRGGHALHVARLGEACLLAGRPEDAIRLAQRALDLSCEHRERGNQAWALRLLGEITSQREPPDLEQAEASYSQALALANELGMRPLQAHCQLGLGKLYRLMRRDEEASVKLSTAVAILREMRMTSWLLQAEAELAQIAASLSASSTR